MYRIEKKFIVLALTLLLGIVYSQLNSYIKTNNVKGISATTAPSSQQIATVTKVIDGDTIQIDTGQKIRYIGMDTPELHKPRTPVQCFAELAYEKNRDLVLGKKIKLVKDVSETDRYGRLLRYIYLQDKTATADGTFVNAYLVQEGYARVLTVPPDVANSDYFLKLQQQAQAQNKGLWSACL